MSGIVPDSLRSRFTSLTLQARRLDENPHYKVDDQLPTARWCGLVEL